MKGSHLLQKLARVCACMCVFGVDALKGEVDYLESLWSECLLWKAVNEIYIVLWSLENTSNNQE